VARLFRVHRAEAGPKCPAGPIFFDADVARHKRDFHKEVFISMQFKAFDADVAPQNPALRAGFAPYGRIYGRICGRRTAIGEKSQKPVAPIRSALTG
jgi:hypothetical protein